MVNINIFKKLLWIILVTSIMSQILSAAPIHKWTLNETASPFLDTIGSTNALCSGAECPRQVTGQISSAVEFDGVNDKLIISQNNLTSFAANESYSIELWMKTDSPSLQVAFGRGVVETMYGLAHKEIK